MQLKFEFPKATPPPSPPIEPRIIQTAVEPISDFDVNELPRDLIELPREIFTRRYVDGIDDAVCLARSERNIRVGRVMSMKRLFELNQGVFNLEPLEAVYVVEFNQYIIWDGAHRHWAAVELGNPFGIRKEGFEVHTIPVYVTEGTLDDALRYAKAIHPSTYFTPEEYQLDEAFKQILGEGVTWNEFKPDSPELRKAVNELLGRNVWGEDFWTAEAHHE